MKVLVLATNYPNLEGGISLYYIHTRCAFYVKKGISVDLINFSSKKDYILDGVNVISYDSYKEKYALNHYDLLISHAPNIRQHYCFIKRFGDKFKKHVYFFHGHEVLMVNKVYSKPFDYMRKKITFLQDLYDLFKLKIWNKHFKKNIQKSYLIFVSNWMKREFIKWTRLSDELIKGHNYITYNSVGELFEQNQYDKDLSKEFDFITIRGNIDGSKYCVDLVNKLAFHNPEKKFLLIGKGKYFEHYSKAPNLTFLKKNLSHYEILNYLNKSKCALMPTRTDAQGLMSCEMATYGIPLITSDIEVCHEIFEEFDNVAYISNEKNDSLNLDNIINELETKKIKRIKKYYLSNTGMEEIKILKYLTGVK